jgi:hypothetical protein
VGGIFLEVGGNPVGQDGHCSQGNFADPSQFQSRALFAGLEQSEGAPKLWFAVLAQPFRDYYGDIPSEGPSRYRKVQVHYCQRSARAWFLSDSASMGSFRWIAELFELDPQAVRKRLFRGSRIDLAATSEESIPPSAASEVDEASPSGIELAAFKVSAPVEAMVAA